MKKSVLLYTLSLTALLTACGGGGGGSGRNVPVSSLPSNIVVNAANSEITTMSSDSFSNENRRKELYDNAVEANASSGMHTMSFSAPDIDTAYGNMKKWLIDNESLTDVDAKDLRLALIMAGFDDDDLPIDSQLKIWTNRNFSMIKLRAKDIYNMYGKKHSVQMDNAKLTSVNIEAEQDSRINLIVNSKGKITGIHFDVDMDSVDARTMDAELSKKNVFKRVGPGYIYVMRIGAYDENVYGTQYDQCPICSTEGNTLELEFFEKLTEADMPRLKKMLIAKLYDEKEQNHWGGFSEEQVDSFVAKTEEWINSWTWDQLRTEDEDGKNLIYFEGSDNEVTTITYKSYGKEVGKKGLQYSDFGTTYIESKEGNDDITETFVFAGGYDVKKINKEKINGKMKFEGDAVVALIHQNDVGKSRVENTESQKGKATLVFDNGAENLTAKFDKWYTVNVNSKAADDQYDIKFSEGNKIANNLYKFKGGNEFEVKDFVGNKNDKSYGAIEIGYYGDKNVPSEATGYVAYGEHLNNSSELNMQIGFGTQKK